jgi:DNA-binding transcriptional ArsR family regulator
VHAFDVLGDPVRRRILELLASGEQSSGEIVTVISTEFGITQPAVSQHLRVLRDSGFASVRPDGTRRIYAIDTGGIDEVDRWLDQLRGFWQQRLDALETEIARGKRERRTAPPSRAASTNQNKSTRDQQRRRRQQR